MNVKNKSQLSCTMFPSKYVSLALYDEDMNKIFEFNKKDGWNLIKITKNPDGFFLIMSIFEFMMIYLIEFNQLINIEISCGGLYRMNQIIMNLRVKQHRYKVTRSKIMRGVIPKNQPRILFIERGKKQLTLETNHSMTSG